MSSLLTINHYINEANSFIEGVRSSNGTYYVFTSRPQPWANSTGGNDDSAIPTLTTSVEQTELDTYNDILYGKLINDSDISNIIPRYNWQSGTVYANYDQRDPDLYTKNFFMVTTGPGDQYNVYKCIDNGGGAQSTVKPTLQTTRGVFSTGDGYTWKYMYTIDAPANTKFTSTNFIPIVANVAVQGNAVPGTIDAFRIANGGVGYNVYETGLIDGVFNSLSIRLPDTSSSLDNYYKDSSIYLKSGFGSGQVRKITSYSGSTKLASLDIGLDTYTRLDFANSTSIIDGTVGTTVSQEVDSFNYTSSVGYLGSAASFVQSDSGVTGQVLTSNSTVMQVMKTDRTLELLAGFPLRNLSDTGAGPFSNLVNITTGTGLTVALISNSGSGYNAAASLTITSAIGSGGAATSTANSSGRINTITIGTAGTGYVTEPTVQVSAPIAQTFNANTAVTEGPDNVIAIATAGVFRANDPLRYSVAAGNTVIGGLTNNASYFIQFANASHIALTSAPGGSRIALTKGRTETGHFIQGVTATVRLFPSGCVAANSTSPANLAFNFGAGDFVRVGQNANNNIRRVVFANATNLVVNRNFASALTSANTFKMNISVLPDNMTTTIAQGVITNTNLDSIRLVITNTSVVGASFIPGERVEFVNDANTSLGANGLIAYSNNSTVFLTGTSGTWFSGQKIRGLSSLLRSDIVSVVSSPNVTLRNPTGTFLLGQTVDLRSPAGANNGIANAVNSINLSDVAAEYEIGPTVSIVGDGTGAVAVARVNTSIETANAVSEVAVIFPGTGYTQANVTVTANSLYGSGAVLTPVISPIAGHGADPVSELGSRYVGINAKFDTTSNESWYYPSAAAFRKIGVLKDPKFANCSVQTANYTVVTLNLTSFTGSWATNEVVVQTTSNATGVVVSGNSSVLNLNSVRGTFNQSLTVTGLTSGSSANVSAVGIVRFANNETITQPSTGASAIVSGVTGTTTLALSNVVGQFIGGADIVGSTSTARANATVITSDNGERNLSTTFGLRFNQTGRVSLTSNTRPYVNSEFVVQTGTGASGRVVSHNRDLDFVLTDGTLVGSFSIGDTITNANTGATSRCIFANSTVIKTTAVSNTSQYVANNTLNNGLGATARILTLHPVLVLSDVSRSANIQVGSAAVIGQTSGAEGGVRLVTKPDLTRESGKVLYSETTDNVITRTLNTTEEVRLVIKF